MQRFRPWRLILIVVLACYIPRLVCAAVCISPPSGLVDWWRAEGGAYDEVGTLDGTLFNGTKFSAGEVGQAFSFDGIQNCVTNSSPGLTNILSSYTIEFWAWPTAARASTAETTQGVIGNSGQRYAIFPAFGGTNNVGSGVSVGTNGISVFEHGYAYLASLLVYDAPITGWTHIAVVYQNNQPTLYVNGVVVRSGLPSTRVSYPSTWLGEWGAQSLNYGYYAGLLDEVSIYNRALSATEISSIYSASTAGKCAPVGPSIVTQPVNQTVYVGGNATFSAGVTGSRPFSYQWTLGGSGIPNGTNPVLSLTNIQFGQAGSYSVRVTNVSGAVVSSNATLTVNPIPSCATAPSGLVSWWRGESNTWDQLGSNDGMFQNGAQYGLGEVDSSFLFDGSGNNVRISSSPSLNVGLTNGLTIEAWINPGDLQSGRPIFEWAITNSYGVHFWINGAGVGSLYANIFDVSGVSHIVQSRAGLLAANSFQHVALTYDKVFGVAQLFLNGVVVQSNSIGVFTPQTSSDAFIGYRPATSPFGPAAFVGLIDEVSLYNRTLSAQEIRAIYAAGFSGKCVFSFSPFIVTQPTNQIVTVGATASFAVSITGTQPFTFQWLMAGKNIPDATNSVLYLSNVQLNQAGLYSVRVTNPGGSVVSSNATLTVNPIPPCVAAPSGLVSWWRGESNAWDQVGGNSGIFQNGAQYASAEVGSGFLFDGSGNNVRIPSSPSLNVGLTNGLTIEAWINPGDLQTGRPIFEWAVANSYGVHFWINGGGAGSLYANLFDTSGSSHIIQSASALLKTNTFQHVALTYDKVAGIGQLFLNGGIVQSNSIGVFTPRTVSDAYIGYRPVTSPFGPATFIGLVDELGLYNRALSPAEIQAVYSAGASGKCVFYSAPFVSSQPPNQVVTLNTSTIIAASVGGAPPLSYQWYFNGAPLIGATTPQLAITNFQQNQAGSYSLLVTNSYGSVVTSNAIVSFKFPPVPVSVVGTNVIGGSTLTVPIIAGANGNENALGFSLSFDPTKLSFVGAVPANPALGGVLFTNTSQTLSGKVGISLALPAYSSFPVGTQQVIKVSFLAAPLASSSLTSVSFGDQPTPRQVWDAQLNSLSAIYSTAAQIIIGAAPAVSPPFEGDAFPRPSGDNIVSLSDWLQIGRYVARLDYPTNSTEFQLSDCAPHATGGDGAITVADWVQVARFAAGLDPLTHLGGPTSEVAWAGAGSSVTRILSAELASMSPGKPFSVALNLAAQGNENALGFSLSFDPSIASFSSASLGTDASGATLLVNTNQCALGRLGVALSLTPGSAFNSGKRQVLTVNFLANSKLAGSFAPAFSDTPVLRDISDSFATSLPASYVGGTNILTGLPLLRITQSGTNVVLSWPLWATNYSLQQSFAFPSGTGFWTNVPLSVVISNSSAAAVLPATNASTGYRLVPP